MSVEILLSESQEHASSGGKGREREVIDVFEVGYPLRENR
jgi:hypothetical protein